MMVKIMIDSKKIKGKVHFCVSRLTVAVHLKSLILLDLRNLYNPATLKSLGLTYEGVGRK